MLERFVTMIYFFLSWILFIILLTIAIEAIQNIQTVIQLTKESYFCNEYCEILNTVDRSSITRGHILSTLFSITHASVYFSIAAFISLGTFLVDRDTVTFEDMFLYLLLEKKSSVSLNKSYFRVLNAVVLAARTIGRELALFPDYGKATEAAKNIFELANKTHPSIMSRKLVMKFSESAVLKIFKLHNKSGQKLALAGTSGCGKSTTIQLIERFYGVNMGRLGIDRKPVLFDMSIRENIAYGDNNRNDISLNEIIQVAKDANIQDLIQLLPNGYETMRDAHGTQLSGEQKTKNWFSSVGKFVTLVIARALIRNPKILLLDKDSENEKIAQEALDRARQNRTSITIAHRLSTIQNADIICIVHNGSMVKSGSDEELLAMGG
ncbi:unnamed protein product [Rotaria socialis]|uniref:Uncharacterized protein n=2 Tax=Rotaria socialis TaxID=392032 RepID=A0A819VPW1_9BILA|nr:unnamed protein product [Rotaria socialis]